MIDGGSPFSLLRMLPPQSGAKGKVLRFISPLADRILGLHQLDRLYNQTISKHKFLPGAEAFIGAAHAEMKIGYEVANGSLDRIPKTGPLVVVSNHPFGAVEATVLLRLLYSVRKDVKFMANFLLGRLKQTEDFCIYVDPFGGEGSSRRNLQPLRESIEWVRKGGVLCVFPSGTVSHYHWSRREITDPPWSPTVARVIRKAGAPVVPIFFPGANGPMFQAIGMIHPMLRTMMLARELYNKCGTTFEIRVGNFIPFSKIATFKTDEEIITYLRLRTYILGNRTPGRVTTPFNPVKHATPSHKMEKIIPPVPADVLKDEVERLPAHQVLVEGENMYVAYARARQIPNLLREIGRLREVTFRGANEGTGNAIDLDQFDRYYIHMFIWHRERSELVGAYRIGKNDRILRRFGKSGLYTSTLFDYHSQLMEQIGPALELGRSFVRPEYQKNYTPLLLLWKGITHYALRYPRYKILFGPVSINNEYDSVSRELITMFLKANNFLPEIAKLIRARNPMTRTKVKGMDAQTTSFVVRDINDVSDLLGDIESRQKSVPILLRQYLKLGGKILGFNVDENFGDVLDGLIFVDLLEADPRLLERYMTKDGLQRFYDYHGKTLVRSWAQGRQSD